MKTTEKLNYIKKQLNEAPRGIYKRNTVIKNLVNYYKNNLDKLELVSEEKIKDFDFVRSVIVQSELAEKESFKSKILRILIKLERHIYAPEMNKIHFKNCAVSTPQRTTINEAIDYFIYHNSLSEVTSIYYNNL